MSPAVTVFSTGICPYCDAAKSLLARKGVAYEEIRVDLDQGQRELMESRSRRRTVPQIFIGDRHIGGFDDMAALDRAGELDSLLHLEPR